MSTEIIKKANRLKSTKMVSKLVNEYWKDIYQIKETDKLLGYTTGMPINPFLAAQDMAWIHGEGYGASVAARHEEKEPQLMSERRGYNRELCSYARTQIGCAMFADRGIPDDMTPGPIAGSIPKADFIVTAYPGCSSGPQWDWAIQRVFGKKMPWYNVSVPFHFGRNGGGYMQGPEFREDVAYVVRQLKGLISFLEEVSGRPYNWDKLKELFAYTKKVATVRMEALALCKAKPAPASFFDFTILLSLVNYLTAWPGSLECMEAVKLEVQDRLKNNITAIPNEKYRLLFMGIMNWNKIGWLADKMANYDACVIAGEYTHHAFWNEPDVIDPEDPLEGIAINLLICGNNLGYPIAEERTMKLCRDYSIDGVLLHTARTCRALVRVQNLYAESLRRKMNISSIMFEGDMVDDSFYQDDLVNTRIEALLESLDAQKNRGY
ncbi:2-hydroxyacyl-CoA dehydratase family protein [bacterium]|nr:2-hydroxyacyl-CoA dehydratase family protein [bacterium]